LRANGADFFESSLERFFLTDFGILLSEFVF
jgi:hypothetical protein